MRTLYNPNRVRILSTPSDLVLRVSNPLEYLEYIVKNALIIEDLAVIMTAMTTLQGMAASNSFLTQPHDAVLKTFSRDRKLADRRRRLVPISIIASEVDRAHQPFVTAAGTDRGMRLGAAIAREMAITTLYGMAGDTDSFPSTEVFLFPRTGSTTLTTFGSPEIFVKDAWAATFLKLVDDLFEGTKLPGPDDDPTEYVRFIARQIVAMIERLVLQMGPALSDLELTVSTARAVIEARATGETIRFPFPSLLELVNLAFDDFFPYANRAGLSFGMPTLESRVQLLEAVNYGTPAWDWVNSNSTFYQEIALAEYESSYRLAFVEKPGSNLTKRLLGVAFVQHCPTYVEQDATVVSLINSFNEVNPAWTSQDVRVVGSLSGQLFETSTAVVEALACVEGGLGVADATPCYAWRDTWNAGGSIGSHAVTRTPLTANDWLVLALVHSDKTFIDLSEIAAGEWDPIEGWSMEFEGTRRRHSFDDQLTFTDVSDDVFRTNDAESLVILSGIERHNPTKLPTVGVSFQTSMSGMSTARTISLPNIGPASTVLAAGGFSDPLDGKFNAVDIEWPSQHYMLAGTTGYDGLSSVGELVTSVSSVSLAPKLSRVTGTAAIMIRAKMATASHYDSSFVDLVHSLAISASNEPSFAPTVAALTAVGGALPSIQVKPNGVQYTEVFPGLFGELDLRLATEISSYVASAEGFATLFELLEEGLRTHAQLTGTPISMPKSYNHEMAVAVTDALLALLQSVAQTLAINPWFRLGADALSEPAHPRVMSTVSTTLRSHLSKRKQARR